MNMNIAQLRQLPLESKTIDQLHAEIKAQAHYFVEKYEKGFTTGKQYTPSMMEFYRRASDTYFQINELLNHLNKYNSVTNSKKCLPCRYSAIHTERLNKTFDKYSSMIRRCKDGWRFNRTTILRNDI